MGTRNLTAVMADGEYKVAQYGQWDGYPSGQGVTILSFLNNCDFEKFKDELKKVSFITKEEWEEIIEKHTDNGSVTCGSEHDLYWSKNLSHLDRDIGGKIFAEIYDGKVKKLKNQIGFAGDSLFCEYAYVVDLDKRTFEVYEGFNTSKIEEGRFLSGDETLESHEGYEPVRLIKEYSLDDLPSEAKFMFDLEPDE